MTLADYLKASVAKRWQPGVFDCCFFAIEWAVTWGKGDPGAEWRGQYSTDFGGLRFVHEAGGLDKLWSRGLASIGIERVHNAEAGDVGLVWAANAKLEPEIIGGVYTGSKWAVAAPHGLAFFPTQPIAVWGPR